MPLQIVCVCMGEYRCVCTICVYASFHVCAVKCRSECVVCVSFTLLPPLPLHSNAAETLLQQTQPQADWVQGGGGWGQKKMVV